MSVRRLLSPLLSGSALLLACSVNCGGDTSSTDDGDSVDRGDGDGDSKGGAGGESGDSESPVTYCRSDKDCKDADELCDTERSVCVGCVTTSDCGENELCRRNDCVAVTPCTSSKNCETDEICADELGYCVDCEGDNDCASNESCVYFSCLPSCDSDKDCAALGMVCFPEHSVCVDCAEDSDCNDSESCNEVGECIPRVCDASDVFCDGELLASCTDSGNGFLVTECEEGCSEAGKTAACEEGDCVTGEEGCACYGNNTCNGTLSCLSNFCVDQTSDGSGGSGSGGDGSGGAGSGGAGSGGAGSGGAGSGGAGSGGAGTGGAGSGGAGTGGAGSGGDCVTITSATPVTSTLHDGFPPFSQSISDGESTINAIRYNWEGWFTYEVTLPESGNYTISVRLADDGYLAGTPDELYNSFTVSLSGVERLYFNGLDHTYDDGASASGDMAFHNVTSTIFFGTGGTHTLLFDNLADEYLEDDIDLYLAYIELCPIE